MDWRYTSGGVHTSSYLMNTAPFFTKWLDLAADQGEDGNPFFVPDLRSSTSEGWGDTSDSSAAGGMQTVYLSDMDHL